MIFNAVDDFHNFCIEWRRYAGFLCKVANHAVNCINFAGFAFFQVLKHTGFKQTVFFDGQRNDCERDRTFKCAFKIKQLYNVFTLYGRKGDAGA